MLLLVKQIEHFTDCFEQSEARAKVDELMDAALTSDEGSGWTQEKRSDIIFFCRMLQKTLDSVYTVSPIASELINIIKSTT